MKTRKRGIKCYLPGESKQEILKTVRRGRLRVRDFLNTKKCARVQKASCWRENMIAIVILRINFYTFCCILWSRDGLKRVKWGFSEVSICENARKALQVKSRPPTRLRARIFRSLILVVLILYTSMIGRIWVDYFWMWFNCKRKFRPWCLTLTSTRSALKSRFSSVIKPLFSSSTCMQERCNWGSEDRV